MVNFSEKRKHQRIEAAIPLRYKGLRANSSLTRGTLTKNLSEGGVRFNTNEFISIIVLAYSNPS